MTVKAGKDVGWGWAVEGEFVSRHRQVRGCQAPHPLGRGPGRSRDSGIRLVARGSLLLVKMAEVYWGD